MKIINKNILSALLILLFLFNYAKGQEASTESESYKFTDYISSEAISKISYKLIYPLSTYLRTQTKISQSLTIEDQEFLKKELENRIAFESKFIAIGFQEDELVVDLLMMVEKGYDITMDARLREARFIEGSSNDFITAIVAGMVSLIIVI